jgi:hypothetical protein
MAITEVKVKAAAQFIRVKRRKSTIQKNECHVRVFEIKPAPIKILKIFPRHF